MKILFLLFAFFIKLNTAFSFEIIRKLEDNNIKLDISEIKISKNNLIIESDNITISKNLTNETNSILTFINEESKNQSINCNFNIYVQDTDKKASIECPINQTISSNFSNSILYLTKQNTTLEMISSNTSITYNYNKINLLTFGEFNTNRNKSTLKAYFEKPNNYEIKKNLFFDVIIIYNNSKAESVKAQGLETGHNLNKTLIYDIALEHENNDIVNITSFNNYCITPNNDSDHITYCDGATGNKTDMKVEYKIIMFYNSKILNPNDKIIKIQGNTSERITLKSNSNNFYLNYLKDNKNNNINCSLGVLNTIYEINCTLVGQTSANIQGATANITEIIGNNNLRVLEEGTGTIAYINGEKENLEVEYIQNTNPNRNPSSSGGLSGGAIAGIVIACVAAVAALIVTAILITRKPPSQKGNANISNSTDNINQR